MYGKDETIERSKENVKNSGEVFTPLVIVDKMNALIPDSAWEDKEFCFLEPACGNGQILVKIFERRIAAGISIEDTLNTLIGMDISRDNIVDSLFRLFERATAQMSVEGMIPQSREWFERAYKLFAIASNNIFRVKDSIQYIKSGELSKRLFFFEDPTGNKQVLSPASRKSRLQVIRAEFEKAKNGTSKVPCIAAFLKKEKNG